MSFWKTLARAGATVAVGAVAGPEAAAGLLGGAAGAAAGKSPITGPLPVGKIMAPVAAVLAAAAAEGVKAIVTGSPFDGTALVDAGLRGGGTAILAHTVGKNALQFGMAWYLNRQRRQ